MSLNPKDAVAGEKVPLHLWPVSATALGSVALLDGMGKYGRNNFVGTQVLASVYVGAALRHIHDWFEGNDKDVVTGLHNLGHALACLAILVEAELHGTLVDDRKFGDPENYRKLCEELYPVIATLRKQHAGKNPKHYDRRTYLQQNERGQNEKQNHSDGPEGLSVPGTGECPHCNGARSLPTVHPQRSDDAPNVLSERGVEPGDSGKATALGSPDGPGDAHSLGPEPARNAGESHPRSDCGVFLSGDMATGSRVGVRRSVPAHAPPAPQADS